MADILKIFNKLTIIYSKSSLILISIWLFLVYIVLGWLVLGALSSYLIQDKISKSELLKDLYTISGVMRVQNHAKIIEDEILEYKEDHIKLKTELQDVMSKAIIIESDIAELEDNTLSLPMIGNLDIGRLIQSVLSNVGKVEEIEESKANENLLKRKKKEKRALVFKIASLKKSINETNTLISSNRDDLNKYLAEHDPVLDTLHELKFMTRFKFEILVTMPIELLTLILTISMGGLGSIIFLTKQFFNYNEESLSWYFFRPFLGMITALVIYILSKSGLSVMASSESVPNPFFMSFLAIVSGLFSEHAYEKIEEVGKNIFATESQKKMEQWEVEMLKFEGPERRGQQPASDKEIRKYIRGEEDA